MLYPLTVNVLYVQTDNIMQLEVTAGPVYTITMNDAAVTEYVITAVQFSDIIAMVNNASNT